MRPSLRTWFGVLFAGLLASSSARAQTVTFLTSGGSFYNGIGTAVPSGSLVLLIADTTRNGFGPLFNGSLLTAGSFLNGDDQILGRMVTASDALAFGTFALIPLASNPSPGAYTALDTGDPLAVVWFSTLTGSTTQLTTGDSYGLYFNSSITATAADGDPWFVPAPGSTILIHFLTVAPPEGTHAASEGRTSFSVSAIPEPSAYAALAGALALGLAFARRRRSAVL